MAIGAGACQISGNFYNNTIVGNIAKTEDATYSNIMCGGMFVYDSAEIYNCIIYNNKEEGGRNIGISAPEIEICKCLVWIFRLVLMEIYQPTMVIAL